jgi:hypothetical protein
LKLLGQSALLGAVGLAIYFISLFWHPTKQDMIFGAIFLAALLVGRMESKFSDHLDRIVRAVDAMAVRVHLLEHQLRLTGQAGHLAENVPGELRQRLERIERMLGEIAERETGEEIRAAVHADLDTLRDEILEELRSQAETEA